MRAHTAGRGELGAAARPPVLAPFPGLLAGLMAGLFGLAGCVEKHPEYNLTGLQSLRVRLMSPAVNPSTGTVGTVGRPVSAATATFDLEALGPDGARWAMACQSDADCCPVGADCTQPILGGARNPVCETDPRGMGDGSRACGFDVDVFLSFAGNKVGQISACGTKDDTSPIAHIHMWKGLATAQSVALLRAFGAAAIWVEDPITHAVGTSPIIYFASPTIPDVQTPLSLDSTTFTWCTPWNGRHVIVDRGTTSNGASGTRTGSLVVTSVFGAGYVVADTGASYDPVKNTGGFNHLYVYTFGKPDYDIRRGTVMTSVAGNVSKFVGFTELTFPLEIINRDAPVVNIPEVYPLSPGDRNPFKNDKLIRLAASTVSLTGTVCPVDARGDQWVKFNQFLIDMDESIDCSVANSANAAFNTFAVEMAEKTIGIQGGQVFNPLRQMGTAQRWRITGMLKNNSGQNDACRGTGGPLNVACRTKSDCEKAAGTTSDTSCQGRLRAAECVEGTCLRGPFNFWTVIPRDGSDYVPVQ